MEALHSIVLDLESRGLGAPVIFDIQKNGYMTDHAEAVSPLVSDNRIFAVDDPYRYSNIKGAPSSARSKYGFGSATHYGQDFIFKSPSDRVYVLSVPYPFSSKESVSRFQTAKLQVPMYKTLGSVLSLINHFECDLFENSLSPMVLAHRYTSISAAAGGGVLNELAASSITAANPKVRSPYHSISQSTSIGMASDSVASAPALPLITPTNGVLNL